MHTTVFTVSNNRAKNDFCVRRPTWSPYWRRAKCRHIPMSQTPKLNPAEWPIWPVPIDNVRSDPRARAAQVRQGGACTKIIFSIAKSPKVGLGFTMACIKMAKNCKYPWSRAKTLEINIFTLNQMTALLPPEKHFLLQWGANSYSSEYLKTSVGQMKVKLRMHVHIHTLDALP